MIDADVKLGANVRIFDPALVNLFGCAIADGTFVGPFVEITRGVTIGRNCLIESHSFICSGVVIEDDVFVGHGVVFVTTCTLVRIVTWSTHRRWFDAAPASAVIARLWAVDDRRIRDHWRRRGRNQGRPAAGDCNGKSGARKATFQELR